MDELVQELADAIETGDRSKLQLGLTLLAVMALIQLKADTNRIFDDSGVPKLYPREREVLVYSSKGFTTKEIAELMGLSTSTITTYLKLVFKKLDVGSREEAAVIAAKAGLV